MPEAQDNDTGVKARLRVTQIGSPIGRQGYQRATLIGLGLNKMHRTRELILAGEAKAPLAVLRLTAVYGADDTHNSYGPNRFVRQALKDGRISLFGDGEETRDHLYVDDAVALMLAVVSHASTGLLNLASG